MAHHRLARFSGYSIDAIGSVIIGSSLALAQAEPTQSIQGCVISGGSNTNINQTCNFNPRFGLTPDNIKSIVAFVPRDKPVSLIAVGGPRAWQMGDDLKQALAAAGLHVEIEKDGMVPGVDEPLTINTDGLRTTIILDPAAR